MTLARFNNYPSLFDQLFDTDLFDWSNRNYSETNTTVPSVNIKENADAFNVEMAVPGFDKKDFKIALDHNVLTISSEKKVENETKEGERFTLSAAQWSCCQPKVDQHVFLNRQNGSRDIVNRCKCCR